MEEWANSQNPENGSQEDKYFLWMNDCMDELINEWTTIKEKWGRNLPIKG